MHLSLLRTQTVGQWKARGLRIKHNAGGREELKVGKRDGGRDRGEEREKEREVRADGVRGGVREST